MGTTISKTYTMTVKYSRDDSEDLAADFLTYTTLKTSVKKAISEVVPRSKGIVSVHIVGEVSET